MIPFRMSCLIALLGFACFKRYFVGVNSQSGKLIEDKGVLTIYHRDLLGIDVVRRIALDVTSPVIAKEAIELVRQCAVGGQNANHAELVRSCLATLAEEMPKLGNAFLEFIFNSE